MDPEIGCDLVEGRALRSAAGHLHDVVAELLWVGLGHESVLPRPPSGQASSDVTPTRSSPHFWIRVGEADYYLTGARDAAEVLRQDVRTWSDRLHLMDLLHGQLSSYLETKRRA